MMIARFKGHQKGAASGGIARLHQCHAFRMGAAESSVSTFGDHVPRSIGDHRPDQTPRFHQPSAAEGKSCRLIHQRRHFEPVAHDSTGCVNVESEVVPFESASLTSFFN